MKQLHPIDFSSHRPATCHFIALSLMGMAGISFAQSVSIELPSVPSGFSRASAIYNAPSLEGKQGLAIAATLAAAYDSNVTQGSDSSDNAESDFILSPGFNASYVTRGEHLIFGALAGGTYDEYAEVSDYSGLSYDLLGFAAYQRGPIVATLSSGIDSSQGTNRYYGDFVEQTNFTNQLLARYRISPKTSLVGSLGHTTRVVETDGYNDTTSFNASLAGLWSATPLLDFGPGFRYGLRTSENQNDLSTLGPNFNLNYQLSTKVTLRSTMGLDFVDGGEDTSDSLVNWSLRLNYRASALWGMNLSLLRDTNANPTSEAGLDEITLYRVGYVRKIRRATLNLGAGFESRTKEGGSSSNQDFDYLTLDSGVSMPVFGDSGEVTVSLRYRNLQSDDSDQSWDGLQTGIGFLWNF